MMLSASPKLIPGSFGSDLGFQEETLPPKLDLNVGTRSHIFQPPRTPSATSSLFRSSSPNRTPLASASPGQRRPRLDGLRGYPSASSVHIGSASSSEFQVTDASMVGSAYTSPAPFVNTRYVLAGGIDTPTSAAALAYGKQSRDHDMAQDSRNWAQNGRKRSIREEDYDDYGYHSYTPAPLAGERNGRPRGGRPATLSERRSGWGRSMINIVGNVAGRVWQFCRASAFRGFYAGGGPGYQINETQTTGEESSWQGRNGRELPEQESSLTTRQATCVRTESPPCPDEIVNEKILTPDSISPRPAKRIQREKGTGELRGQWIMISPSNGLNGHAFTVSPSRRAGILETEKHGSRLGTSRGRAVTSRVGRRPGFSPSKPSTVSHAGSPGLRARGQASFASARLPSSPGKDSIEVSIQRFNRQLKEMIREGKEALGTRFEIREEERDEMDLDGVNHDDDDVDDNDGFQAGVNEDYFT